ncbi:MAG: class I SAM-dependent methyltransferase [Candidatus Omnitrophica bacterium]|nr:class I SAM-dependent methyltransferase [Candidatus Omnitrophota bacterium]
MRQGKAVRTDEATRKAWRENWEEIDIATIMGIFTYPRVIKIKDTVISYLPRGGSVLEAGCGLGPWVIKLRGMGYDISGVDYDDECMRKIREYDPSQKVSTADIRDLPFGSGSFDAYLSFGVIEHFAEGPDKALREAYRVLKDGGRLILSVPYFNVFLGVKAPLNLMKRSRSLRRLMGKPEKNYYYQRYFNVGELERAITNGGFHIERTMPVDHIFSLVEFSGFFRDKKVYDRENSAAVRVGGFLERYMPWAGAGSVLVVAVKKGSGGVERRVA